MKFSELISGSSYGADNVRAGGIDVTGIAYDSRKIKPGKYFAIKGLKDDGNKFIEPAINKGAKIIFTEEEIPAAADAEIIKVSNIRKLMAELSGKYYFDNSSKLRLIE